MSKVQVEQKISEMPPREGFTVAHSLTVADIERSARFYETVFGGRILSRADSPGAPATNAACAMARRCCTMHRSNIFPHQ
jgi:predicted enzyme related to lactoylglutathione lyase